MPLGRRFVLTASGLFICLAIYAACKDAQAQQQDAFLEAQITAIQTRNVKPLEPFAFEKPSVKLAAELTKVAVDELNGQVKVRRVPDVVVDDESALLTAKFINRGAEVAVKEDLTETREPKAEGNLRLLIDKMVELSVSEHGNIGKTTFITATKGVCPLWPFC